MFEFFGLFSEYYFVVLVLQGFCLYHTIKRGTHQKWIWVIVFLPFIGSLIYIFTEIIKKNQIKDFKGNVINLFNPNNRIKVLEKKLRFSETFQNKVALAYAYQALGRNSDAIPLFESALSGIHSDDSHVLISLLEAFYAIENYEKVVEVGNKLVKSSLFAKSDAILYYAVSLEKINKLEEAKDIYEKLDRKMSNFQARYYYALFLVRTSKSEKARSLFETIIDESEYLEKRELREARPWIQKAKEELKKMQKVN